MIEKLNGMSQLVHNFTRVTDKSATLKDVILSTHPMLHQFTRTFECTLSDHYLVYTAIDVVKGDTLNKHNEIRYRCFKNFNSVSFINDIENSDIFKNIYNNTNVDNAWNEWKIEFIRICNKHAPVRIRRMKDRYKPWVNNEILKLMYKRNFLHKRAVKYADIDCMDEYKIVKAEIEIRIQQSKNAYYDELYKGASSQPKVLWNELKRLSGKKSTYVNVSNDCHNASEFNDFFSNVGITTTQHLPVPDNVMWKGQSSIYEFKFNNVEEISVKKLLCNLGSNSSLDILTFDCKLLKLAATYITPSLTHLFNISLQYAIVPKEWKYSRVTPIYKGSGDVKNCSNYRPISVIGHLAKMFEKEIQYQLLTYLVSHDFISLDQYAYKKFHSTSNCLHTTIDEWLQNIDDNLKTGVTFLDISKCFDTINHKLLIAKLEKYGIRNNESKWFKSYLTDRCQSVYYNNEMSDVLNINIGVPQGSNLGPLLFTIFVNDLPNFIGDGRLSMYADDTIIYCKGKQVSDINNDLNDCVNKAATWFTSNCLALNVNKTVSMLVDAQVNCDEQNILCVKLNDQIVENLTVTKYLGVHVDRNLKFDKHILEIVKKISGKLAWLGRLRHIVPRNLLELTYKMYVLPLFDYACTVWGCTDVNVNIIQRLQNRAARLITGCFDIINIRGITLVKSLKWQNIQERINYFLSIHMYNCIHGNAPLHLVNSIVMACDVHEVNTRLANSSNVVIPECHTQYFKRSFLYRASVIWNSLPEELKDCNNVNLFKCKAKIYFS